MIDESRAFDADNGVIVTQENSETTGPFYTGGPDSPVGMDLSVNTFYLQTTGAGVLIFRKFGPGANDWRQLSAEDIPFDNTGTDIVATTVQNAITEQASKGFGKDYSFSIRTTQLDVSGGAFQTYLTHNFNVSDDSGVNEYRANFNFHWNHKSTANDIRVQYVLDGGVISEMRIEPKDSGDNQRIPGTYIDILSNLSQGAHTLEIQFRPATASRVSGMFRATIDTWRVT